MWPSVRLTCAELSADTSNSRRAAAPESRISDAAISTRAWRRRTPSRVYLNSSRLAKYERAKDQHVASHHARNVVTTAAQKMIPNAVRARSPRVGMIEHPSAVAESTPVGCRNTPDLTCLALSVFGRFISQIVDFIFLFVRFISLFGRVGNLHSDVSQYQCLAGMGRVARPPGIGFSQYFTVDQGTRPGRLAPPPAPSAGTEGRAPRAG
jgi:hypothetical protein